MVSVCPMTCLVYASEGVAFAPVEQVSQTWQLQSIQGHVLVGYRGKPYEFNSAFTARQWLRDNRNKASYGKKTSLAQIKRIQVIQFEVLAQFLEVELTIITQRNLGQRFVTAESELDDCDCENEPLDGGNAISTY